VGCGNEIGPDTLRVKMAAKNVHMNEVLYCTCQQIGTWRVKMAAKNVHMNE
jgi:hypothetical protein